MKKNKYVIFFIMTFFLFSLTASAKQIITVIGDEVRFRTEATTSSKIITELNSGTELDLISEDGGSGNGCTKWYKGKYNNQYGYICSEYVILKEIDEVIINPDDYAEQSEYLKELGFP